MVGEAVRHELMAGADRDSCWRRLGMPLRECCAAAQACVHHRGVNGRAARTLGPCASPGSAWSGGGTTQGVVPVAASCEPCRRLLRCAAHEGGVVVRAGAKRQWPRTCRVATVDAGKRARVRTSLVERINGVGRRVAERIRLGARAAGLGRAYAPSEGVRPHWQVSAYRAGADIVSRACGLGALALDAISEMAARPGGRDHCVGAAAWGLKHGLHA